LKKPR